MSYTDFLNRLKNVRNNLVSILNRFNIQASTTESFTELSPKFDNIAKDTTATTDDIMLGKTAYINGNKVTGTYSDGIMPLVNNITVSGSYSDASYQTYAGAFYERDGKVAIIMKSGTTTAYENLNFSLASAPAGVSLAGQSVCNYSSATAGQYYVAVLTGITSKVDISIHMSSRNSTYDYVQCAMTITESQV